MVELVIAVLAGVLIGLSLGALGGGGSILAVPVLVYGLGQTAPQATTGSLVVVGITSLIGATAAWRADNVQLRAGMVFGALSIGGAALGAMGSKAVAEPVLLAGFAILMVVVGLLMAVRQIRVGRRTGNGPAPDDLLAGLRSGDLRARRVLRLLTAATGVGLLTGFFGVGGGFLVVPALVLVLGLPMTMAAGTSLVVIVLTSGAALVARLGIGVEPVWGEVLTLTVASAVGAVVGARVADRVDAAKLSGAFTGLVLLVAAYTASQSLPQLF